MTTKLFFTTLLAVSILPFPRLGQISAGKALAQTSSIDVSTVHFTDEIPTPTPGETTPVKKIAPEKPYVVFQDSPAQSGEILGISLSDMIVDYGELSPSNPVTRTFLARLFSSRSSAEMFVWEEHPLKQTTGAIIPDTTCDNGSCSESTAAIWGSGLTYGFGYHCDDITGSGCPKDFSDSAAFRQFADASNQEHMQSIVTHTGGGKETAVKLSAQINVPGTQAPGSYATSITLLANPGF